MRKELLVPAYASAKDWPRKVAAAVQFLLSAVDTQANPFQQFAAAPSTPVEGQTYYDTVLHKSRTWDGTAWQNHW